MRFVIITDTRFYAPGRVKDGVWWNRTLQSSTDEIGRCLVETISPLRPDFVIHCSDISGHCDLANFHAGLGILDRLPCPWYAVLGNHDTCVLGRP